MKDINFSVIVLTYNSNPSKIILTLESILQQEFPNMEIIISDDASENDSFEMIRDYFQMKGFTEFVLIKNNKNIGTVNNQLGAVLRARGRYIKSIGAGDLLYRKTTLKEVYDFLSVNQYLCCFGRMKSYYINKDKNVKYCEFSAPRYLHCFKKKQINRTKILRNMLVFRDWISGSEMFFERKFYIYLLKQITGKVIYCEDLFQVLCYLKRDYMHFIDTNVIWYEYGTGISTSRNHKFAKAMQKDHEEFISIITGRFGKSKVMQSILKERSKSTSYKKLFGYSIKRNYEELLHKFDLMLEEIKGKYAMEEKGFLDDDNSTITELTKLIVD